MTTLNGVPYSASDFYGYAYITKLLEMATNWLADAGRNLTTTSATSLTIGTGVHVVTLADAVPFSAGGYVKLSDTTSPETNFMWGTVTSRSGTTLNVNITDIGGSGTISSWNVVGTGPKGATGSTSMSGNATGAIDMNGNTLTADEVLFQEGSEWKVANTSSPTGVSGTQAAIAMKDGSEVWIVADGDVTQPISAPTSGYIASMTLILEQDGTGGRTFTITDASTEGTWIGNEPNWGSLAAGTKMWITASYRSDGALYLSHIV